MSLKVLVSVALASCINVAFASIAYAPVSNSIVDTEYDHNPQYTYSYGVDDPLTGDSKSQTETRNGDVVTGQYSLIEPDGSKRIVDYTADSIHGFNAVVRKAFPAAPVALSYSAPVVAKVAPSLAYAAHPVVSKLAAPTVYSEPVVRNAAAVPAAINSISYESPGLTKAIIHGPSAVSYNTGSHGYPFVYSGHLANSVFAAPSLYSAYPGYTPVFRNVHY